MARSVSLGVFRMLGNDAPVLTDYDALVIGMDLDRAPDGAGRDRVFVVVEAHQAGLGDRCRHRVESVEPAGIGNELRPFDFEHVPDRLIGQFRIGDEPWRRQCICRAARR